jgi:hypothetical protein
MRIHPHLLRVLAAALLAITLWPTPAPAQAASCYATRGALYCGNYAPTPIYQLPSFGREDRGVWRPTPTVDTLKTSFSYFKCWVRGDHHPGGNQIWYYTNGDVTSRYGYVPANRVFTPRDSYPGVSECGHPAPPPAPAPPAPTPTPRGCDGTAVVGHFKRVDFPASFEFRGRKVELQNESALDTYSRAEIRSGHGSGDLVWIDRSFKRFRLLTKGIQPSSVVEPQGWKQCGPYAEARTQSVINSVYAARACARIEGTVLCGQWYVD